ncbi:hypothetical protein L211DRAFT_850184 [Terfezia boudieri ATCC MYA-4762]|uniref:Uncharacterized protein n=1 Tax=Terfezia boudieri ATCC MYA-4762 TaxID=1051890 RepID=A0A3N4LRD3_9PEZI|nr:hypothetical protein L211DRAFT_850184 [Terfezia boudieri ATCC MYA-4762]
MALEECPPTSPVTTAHDGEGENIPVTVPPDLTAWFEDIDTTEHTLIQPLSDIRAILTHFTNRFQVQALEIPLEGQQFPSLLTQADEFIALLNEATLTLHHPDLLDWFAGQPWESNKITFGNAWTAAKYMRLDFSYIIQMINERIKALEVKGDKEGLAMARELRQIFENADETVYMAHQTMNGHLESLKGLFPEAFDIEAEDLADPFWGRRGRKQEAAN